MDTLDQLLTAARLVLADEPIAIIENGGQVHVLSVDEYEKREMMPVYLTASEQRHWTWEVL